MCLPGEPFLGGGVIPRCVGSRLTPPRLSGKRRSSAAMVTWYTEACRPPRSNHSAFALQFSLCTVLFQPRLRRKKYKFSAFTSLYEQPALLILRAAFLCIAPLLLSLRPAHKRSCPCFLHLLPSSGAVQYRTGPLRTQAPIILIQISRRVCLSEVVKYLPCLVAGCL